METNTIYDVDYFINKFEAINSDDWGTNNLDNHCTFYHCGARNGENWTNNKEVLGLINIVSDNRDDGLGTILTINDNWVGNKIKGNTPKERILNYLYQIRDKQLQS